MLRKNLAEDFFVEIKRKIVDVENKFIDKKECKEAFSEEVNFKKEKRVKLLKVYKFGADYIHFIARDYIFKSANFLILTEDVKNLALTHRNFTSSSVILIKRIFIDFNFQGRPLNIRVIEFSVEEGESLFNEPVELVSWFLDFIVDPKYLLLNTHFGESVLDKNFEYNSLNMQKSDINNNERKEGIKSNLLNQDKREPTENIKSADNDVKGVLTTIPDCRHCPTVNSLESKNSSSSSDNSLENDSQGEENSENDESNEVSDNHLKGDSKKEKSENKYHSLDTACLKNEVIEDNHYRKKQNLLNENNMVSRNNEGNRYIKRSGNKLLHKYFIGNKLINEQIRFQQEVNINAEGKKFGDDLCKSSEKKSGLLEQNEIYNQCLQSSNLKYGDNLKLDTTNNKMEMFERNNNFNNILDITGIKRKRSEKPVPDFVNKGRTSPRLIAENLFPSNVKSVSSNLNEKTSVSNKDSESFIKVDCNNMSSSKNGSLSANNFSGNLLGNNNFASHPSNSKNANSISINEDSRPYKTKNIKTEPHRDDC